MTRALIEIDRPLAQFLNDVATGNAILMRHHDIDAVEADRAALDEINLLLSADVWPGASGMEDVCDIVRRVRDEIPDAPDWERH